MQTWLWFCYTVAFSTLLHRLAAATGYSIPWWFAAVAAGLVSLVLAPLTIKLIEESAARHTLSRKRTAPIVPQID